SPNYPDRLSDLPGSLPRWSRQVHLRLLPCPRGFPRYADGSAPTTSLARPARASPALRPVRLFTPRTRALSRGFRPGGSPSKRLVRYRALPMAARVGPSPRVIYALGAHCIIWVAHKLL